LSVSNSYDPFSVGRESKTEFFSVAIEELQSGVGKGDNCFKDYGIMAASTLYR